MIENINKDGIVKAIRRELNTHTELFDMVLDAYNIMRIYEYEYSDYIYNLDKKDDLIACVSAGLTAKEIETIYSVCNDDSHYVLFNDGKIESMLERQIDVLSVLASNLDELVNNILLYPWVTEYMVLYTKYVTNPNLD